MIHSRPNGVVSNRIAEPQAPPPRVTSLLSKARSTDAIMTSFVGCQSFGATCLAIAGSSSIETGHWSAEPRMTRSARSAGSISGVIIQTVYLRMIRILIYKTRNCQANIVNPLDPSEYFGASGMDFHAGPARIDASRNPMNAYEKTAPQWPKNNISKPTTSALRELARAGCARALPRGGSPG